MFRPEVAFIMRSDEMIKEYNLKRITVDTHMGQSTDAMLEM